MHFPDDILDHKDRLVNGVEITSYTLIGVIKSKFPVRHGNCFSMKASNGIEYKIVNFYYENIKEGISRGKLTLPVRLYILGDIEHSRTAIIYDPKIPTSWYSARFCETCCPVEYLPFPQRITHALKRESGAVTEKKSGDMIVVVERVGAAVDWRTEEEKNPIVYMNYQPMIMESIVCMGAEVEAEMMKALEAEYSKETNTEGLFKEITLTSNFRGFKADDAG
jgi:hypothetical protein